MECKLTVPVKSQISSASTDSGHCSPSLDPSYSSNGSYFADESFSDGLIYLTSHQVQEKIFFFSYIIIESNEFTNLNDQLYKQLTQLVSLCNEMSHFADDYDYKNIPANGYRTILRLFARMLQITSNLMNRRDRVQQFINAISKLNPILRATLDLRGKQLQGIDDEKSHRDLLALALESSPDVLKVTLNSKYLVMNFPNFKKIARAIVRSFAIMAPTYSAGKKIKKYKFDQITELCVDTLANAGFKRIPTFMRLMDTPWTRFSNSLIRFAVNPVKCSTKRITKQLIPSRYKIQLTANGTNLIKRNKVVTRRVNFSILKNQSTPDESVKSGDDSGKLMLFLHGGAFLGPPAACLDAWYVKDFACCEQDLTVINYDYPLSPEHRFPVALESVVDFYLWLTNAHDQVEELLGFKPKQIIVSGDSAGGNLSAALLVVLNDIRRDVNLSIDNVSIQMPASVALFMPKMTLELRYFPSMFYALFDPVISTIVMSRVGEMHMPIRKKDPRTGQWKLVTGRYTKGIKTHRNQFLDDSDNDDDEIIDEDVPKNYFAKNEYEFLPSVYHSPLNYPHLDELAEVKLVVLTTTFCSLMDESIEIVRRWSGQKSLYMVDPSFHGSYGLTIICPKKVVNLMQACAAAIQDAFTNS